MLKLHDSSTFYSPYPVRQQTLRIEFDSLVGASGGKAARSAVVFEEQGAAALQWKAVWAHGVNNHPQAQFYEVERVVEVSHWGNIRVESAYKLTNLGAAPAGEFSRLDYSERTKNAFRSTRARLPADAWKLYYRDEVGNITTSHARRTARGVELEITTRFMLLGGWNSNFTISYNLPSGNYLSQSGTRFSLARLPWAYEFADIPAAKYTLRVVLPEDSEAALAQHGRSFRQEASFSYLDFKGRPTLVFEQLGALGSEMEAALTLEYEFRGWVWMEWLYCVGAVTLLFVGGVLLGQVELQTLEAEYEEDKKII